MRVSIDHLLEFFDEAPDGSSRHSTSLASLLGEDLSAALFKHYLVNEHRAAVNLLGGTPTTGRRKGHWLDRWIKVDFPGGKLVLFQAEIKSWSAHATHGERLMKNADDNTICQYRIRHWKTFWDRDSNTFNPKWQSLAKVLIPMQRPLAVDNRYEQLPLLIYWMAIHPEGKAECYFPIQLGHPEARQGAFLTLWVFSISSYLRTLHGGQIQLDLPDVSARRGWLMDFFPEERAGGG